MVTMVQYKLKDDYWDKYVKDLRQINLSQVNQAAKDHIAPNAILWMVVGDRSRIEESVRNAGLGDVIILDAEGQQVQ